MKKTRIYFKNRFLHCAVGLILCLAGQSCFPESELFVNISSSKNVPLNIVLPIIYQGDIPIKAEELQNSEKYSLLGNCAVSVDTTKKDPKKESSEKSKDDDNPSIDPSGTKTTGTPIPLFIIPTKGHSVVNGQVQQVVYVIPEPLGPGEHYCLNIAPMYKETQTMDAVTQVLSFEFDAVGKKLTKDTEYGGPKYTDPDIFAAGFPSKAQTDDQKDFAQNIAHRASSSYPPLLKFSKSGMSNDAFAANPEKIRDSIEVCRILSTPEWEDLTKDNKTVDPDRKCASVSGFQVKMLEDLAYDESGHYILANYDYFSITGGALKPGNAYQIKVMYAYGDSKEDLSQSDQDYTFMVVEDDQIVSPESEESLSAKTFFDAFKTEQGQVPGDSYVEIPIRSQSSTKNTSDK